LLAQVVVERTAAACMQGIEDEHAVLIQVGAESKAELGVYGSLLCLKQGVADFLGKNPIDQLVLVLEMVVEALAVQAASLTNLGDGDFLYRRGLQQLLQRGCQCSFGNHRIRHVSSILIESNIVKYSAYPGYDWVFRGCQTYDISRL